MLTFCRVNLFLQVTEEWDNQMLLCRIDGPWTDFFGVPTWPVEGVARGFKRCTVLTEFSVLGMILNNIY